MQALCVRINDIVPCCKNGICAFPLTVRHTFPPTLAPTITLRANMMTYRLSLLSTTATITELLHSLTILLLMQTEIVVLFQNWSDPNRWILCIPQCTPCIP